MEEKILYGNDPEDVGIFARLSQRLSRSSQSRPLSTSSSVRSNSRTTSSYQHLRSQLTSQFDCCLVFLVDHKELDGISVFAKRYIRKLVMNGLNIFIYSNGIYNFILIKAAIDKLRQVADSLQYKFLLNSNILQQIAENGDQEIGIRPIHINHDPKQSHLTPYQYIYAKYRLDLPEELYEKQTELNHPFRSSIRFKLVLAMIVSKPSDGSFPIKIRPHIHKKNIVAFYPLHDLTRLEQLRETWLPLTVLPWALPFYDIKVSPPLPSPHPPPHHGEQSLPQQEYFGEKIALYYRFLGHYSLWLLFPALLSIPIQLYLLIIQDFHSPAQVVFATLLLLWSSLMLQYWKRQQSLTALEWGMIDFGLEEVNRPGLPFLLPLYLTLSLICVPEFKGQIQHSAITGRKVFFFPPKKRRFYLIQSALIIMALTAVALGTVSIIPSSLPFLLSPLPFFSYYYCTLPLLTSLTPPLPFCRLSQSTPSVVNLSRCLGPMDRSLSP
jgi:hypothetical protein